MSVISISIPRLPFSANSNAANASPPSDKSVQAFMRCLLFKIKNPFCFSTCRSTFGGVPSCRLNISSIMADCPKCPNVTPTASNKSPSLIEFTIGSSSSPISPTAPIVGVGNIGSPSVSLYKLTLPETIGISNCLAASAIPSIARTSCPIISGFSGLPKFKLSVEAIGFAPTAQRLRNASATACLPPSNGSAFT